MADPALTSDLTEALADLAEFIVAREGGSALDYTERCCCAACRVCVCSSLDNWMEWLRAQDVYPPPLLSAPPRAAPGSMVGRG